METFYLVILICLLVEFFTQGHYIVKIYKLLEKHERYSSYNAPPSYPPYQPAPHPSYSFSAAPVDRPLDKSPNTPKVAFTCPGCKEK